MIDIIKNHNNTVKIELVEIDKNFTVNQLFDTIYDLMPKVLPTDIVLCAWAIKANDNIDDLFNELASYCNVVAAAGNFRKPIENYSPVRAEKVIAVGTLNKTGLVAALSNYSNSKKIVWIPGTNYDVGYKVSSGTSVSAAIYAAFLDISIKNNDKELLDKLIQDHIDSVFLEINK
jgi:hypothetical protein